MNKKYYQQLLEEMAKELLKEKNKLSQILETNVKKYKTHSIGYSTDDLDVVITFKQKRKKEQE